jgi:hypothetical protein
VNLGTGFQPWPSGLNIDAFPGYLDLSFLCHHEDELTEILIQSRGDMANFVIEEGLSPPEVDIIVG